MRRKWIRRGMLVALAIIAASAGGWYNLPPDRRGVVAAHVHQAAGYDVIKTYGMSPRWYSAYQKSVWDQHHVWIDDSIQCEVTVADLEYIRGYNSVSERRIKARLGDDPSAVFAPLAMEAQANR